MAWAHSYLDNEVSGFFYFFLERERERERDRERERERERFTKGRTKTIKSWKQAPRQRTPGNEAIKNDKTILRDPAMRWRY